MLQIFTSKIPLPNLGWSQIAHFSIFVQIPHRQNSPSSTSSKTSDGQIPHHPKPRMWNLMWNASPGHPRTTRGPSEEIKVRCGIWTFSSNSTSPRMMWNFRSRGTVLALRRHIPHHPRWSDVEFHYVGFLDRTYIISALCHSQVIATSLITAFAGSPTHQPLLKGPMSASLYAEFGF